MSDTRTATADADGMFSQAGRSIAIDTPLGPDALLLTSVQGEDRISQPFVYTVEFLTMAGDSAVRGLIGKRVTLWLHNNHESWRRPVNGYVRRITGQPTSLRGYGGYRAEVAPRLWFLDCTADCRIFQTMTYPAIIKTVLDENGVTGCDFKLLKTDYPTVDYCVQYRESALAFISRLMEHVGIFFFHEHSAADHKLVITDANSFTKFTTPRQLRTAVGAEVGDIQKVWSDTTFKPGAWVLTDYDFEAPSKLMKKQVKTTLSVAMMPQHEWFDFPGGYTDQDVGTWLTRVRMEAEEAHHDKLLGLGSTAAMDPGFRFDLAHSGSADDEPATYLITEVRHRAEERSYFQEIAAEYSSEFVAIPAATPFRPERVTPKSVVRGSQTATVVSPSSGDPIHTDEYGRVKVHFHWDRRGKRSTGATSCWVRVCQNSAGAGFGGIAIPHAGQEVVVDFLEGDPDRPLIVGRVHNAEKIAPIELPLDKHKTITRDHGGNKIVMDGEGGAQSLSIVGPKTLNFIAVSDTAKPLSAAVPFASVTPNPFNGQKPGLAALQSINSGAGSSGGSAAGLGQSINSVAEFCMNSFSGQDRNDYTNNTLTTWTGGDYVSTTVGNASHWVSGHAKLVWKGAVGAVCHGNWDEKFNGTHGSFVAGAKTELVAGAKTETVGGVKVSMVAGSNTAINLINKNEFTWAKRFELVKGAKTSFLADDSKENVKGKKTLKVLGSFTSDVGGVVHSKCGDIWSVYAAGAASLTSKSGGIQIDASSNGVSIKGGATKMSLNPGEFSLTAKTMSLDSSSTIVVKGSVIQLG